MSEEVGKLDVVMTASGGQVASEVDRVNAKFDEMVAKAASTSNRMVAGNRSTAASVGGVVRSVEEHVEAIDHLGQKSDDLLGKSHTVWLGIGAIVGGQTQSMIDKVIAFIDQANAIPGAVEAGFRPLIDAQYMANDAQTLTNASLEKQIAIMEHQPVNNAAIAMAEARIQADKLVASLGEINTKMESVLSKNHISAWRLLIGKAPTANVEGTIGSINEQIEDLARQSRDKRRSGDKAGADALDQQRRDLLVYAREHLSDMMELPEPGAIGMMQKGIKIAAGQFGIGINFDDSGKAAMVKQTDTVLANEQGADADSDQEKKDADRLRKDQEAERQRQLALEAERKAQQEQMQRFRDGLTEREQDHKLAIGEEYFYWLGMQRQTAEGSANWIAINDKLGPLYQQMQEKLDEAARKRAETIKKWDTEAQRYADQMDKAQHRGADNQAEYASAVLKNLDDLKALQIAEEAGSGAISRRSAAVQLATLHANTYAAALQRLKEEEQNDLDDASLTADQREANAQGRAVRKVNIEGERDRTSFSDAKAVQNATMYGGAQQALDSFTASATNAAQQISTLVTNVIEGINRQILAEMMGNAKRGDWRKLGGSVFEQASGSALKEFEGYGLKTLGIAGKKPGESSQNPLWVRNVDGTSTPFPSIFGQVPKLNVSSAGGQQASGGIGAFLAKLFSRGGGGGSSVPGASDFGNPFGEGGGDILPGFATGGDPEPNSWAMVGEQGPEPVFFGSTPAHVVPNNRMADVFAGVGSRGGGVRDIHIDARGTDAALVEARTRVGIRQGMAHAQAQAQKQMQESFRRSPR